MIITSVSILWVHMHVASYPFIGVQHWKTGSGLGTRLGYTLLCMVSNVAYVALHSCWRWMGWQNGNTCIPTRKPCHWICCFICTSSIFMLSWRFTTICTAVTYMSRYILLMTTAWFDLVYLASVSKPIDYGFRNVSLWKRSLTNFTMLVCEYILCVCVCVCIIKISWVFLFVSL